MVTIVISILEAFKKWILENKDSKEKQIAKEANLLKVLGEACRETEMALKKLRAGDNSEMHLLQTTIANKWILAASLLKEKDQELARLAYSKGASWTDAENWSEDDYNKARENIRMIDDFVQNL